LSLLSPLGEMLSAPEQTDDTEGAARGAALMARYCDGEAGAFRELYGWLAPRLLAYLRGFTGEHAAAEDLLQVTFMKVHQARAAYVRGANPIPWIYVIARRSCLDELRRRKRGRVRLQAARREQQDATAHLTGVAESRVPDDMPDDADPGPAMAALEVLPPSQRDALLLTKVHGRSLVEAAVLTGATVGAIKQRVHRAYLTLRQVMGTRGAIVAQP
jgi:RNA polymerase sigma factor (sigma-70 family)